MDELDELLSEAIGFGDVGHAVLRAIVEMDSEGAPSSFRIIA